MSQYYTNKQIFYVNSANRLTGTTSNFSINIDVDDSIVWTHVTLLDASIPKSYYIVPSDRNTFTCVDQTGTRTITLPAGNYTRTSICRVLAPLLTNTELTYAITYENIITTVDTGKLTFTITANGGYSITSQPQFIFTNALYEQLGFDANSTNTFVANTLSSSDVINLSPEGTLFITSNICQNKGDAILANIITPQDSSFSYVIYNNYTPHDNSKIYNGKGSNTYWFKLVDENNNIIDLNGLNLVFTIMIYKENTIDNLIKGYIKYKTLIQ